MVKRSAVAAFVLVLVGVAGTLSAQEAPEQFVERYMAALRANEWLQAADMIHPEVQEEVHRIFQPLITSASEQGAGLREELLGVHSSDAAARLSSQEILARFLQYVTVQAGDVFQAARIEVLGHVEEGNLAHVVYRMHMEIDGNPITRVDVMSLQRDGDAWRGLMRVDLSEFERVLQRALPDSTGGGSR